MARGRRKAKLESLILREISSYLIKEVQNPGIGFVSVLGVELNKDFTLANVIISILGSEKKQIKSFQALKTTSNYLQYLLGKNLRIKNTPIIRFSLSKSLKEGSEMVDLLESLEEKSNIH